MPKRIEVVSLTAIVSISYGGLLICLIATLVALDIATRNDSVTLSGSEAPDIKAAFIQPKPMGSIFPKATDTRLPEVHQAKASNSSATQDS